MYTSLMPNPKPMWRAISKRKKNIDRQKKRERMPATMPKAKSKRMMPSTM